MEDFLLNKLKKRVTVGLVGGSDLKKIAEQMGGMDGEVFIDYAECFEFDYISLLTNSDQQV